jgi:hypothetical protein
MGVYLTGVHLIGVYLIGVYLIDMCLERVFHRRASHGRAGEQPKQRGKPQNDRLHDCVKALKMVRWISIKDSAVEGFGTHQRDDQREPGWKGVQTYGKRDGPKQRI